MIQPLTNETVWLCVLDTKPVWQVPTLPMLIVAPHPDDETLGAGGLIAAQRSKGLEVIVAAVTDGERGFPYLPDLADIRRAEQTRALGRLGVPSEKIVRFGLPDSKVESHEQDLVERLIPLVTEQTHIITTWQGDFHPDHQACGRAAEQVARRTGAILSSYFFWTWHHGVPVDLEGLSLRRFPLDADSLLAKSEALLHHRTQIVQETGEPVLPELLLKPARRPFEVFAVT